MPPQLPTQLINFIMRSDVEQNNDFSFSLRILFNGKDYTTILAARAGLKTFEVAAQFVRTQVWGKYVCFHLLKSVFNTLLDVNVSLYKLAECSFELGG
ncbi:hypothetical protein MiSe_41960 [Microseira wollei NIES-4236]|uniref:Transposase n=1 Tax=Microseira wollei NIES-4236 TaxID=2530354 RepID=A0AAV3XGA8_9CYAN|nr:hypothetical protein [Microseira wollei]GET39427.1 hypothetical protein MiSe_41960 [Microseira wollei NIES-4236]